MGSVSNTIKEFSENYKNLSDVYKYVVQQKDGNIRISLQEYSGAEWIEEEYVNISMVCAEQLFTEVLGCIQRGEFNTESYLTEG